MQKITDYCGVCGAHMLGGVCASCQTYHQRRLESIGLPAELANKDFGEFNRECQPSGLDNAVKFVNDWPHDHCLLFTGPPGTGKSHLIAAIFRDLYSRHNVRGRYQSVLALTTRWKHAEDWGKFGREVVEPLYEWPLIALDEIGREAKTDQWLAELDTLLASRYGNKLPTLLATNLGLDKFVGHIGGSAWSRLNEWAQIVRMKGDSPDNDYRQRLKDANK